jgi:hypothetical protein
MGNKFVIYTGVVVIELWWVMIGNIWWCGLYLSDGVSGTKGRWWKGGEGEMKREEGSEGGRKEGTDCFRLGPRK